MCACQDESIDLLMYYDARPSGFNGLFKTDCLAVKLKGYYPFLFFNELYKLGTQIKTITENDIYCCGATDGKDGAVMITYFNDDDNSPEKKITVDLSGMSEGLKEISIYNISDSKDGELVFNMKIFGQKAEIDINTPLYNTYLVKIKSL